MVKLWPLVNWLLLWDQTTPRVLALGHSLGMVVRWTLVRVAPSDCKVRLYYIKQEQISVF